MYRIAKEAVLASCLGLVVSLLGGCRVDLGESSIPLVPAAGVGPGPAVHRIELKRDGGDLPSVERYRLRGSTSPFDQTLYDAARDRFLVAGRYSIDRRGNVTLDPEPMTGPPGAKVRPIIEILVALGICESQDCERKWGLESVAAVWFGRHAIVVLTAPLQGNRLRGSRFLSPDRLTITSLHPETLERIRTVELNMPTESEVWGRKSPGSVQRMMERFVRDGTVVVDAGLGRRIDRGGVHVAKDRRRISQVRVDPNGAMTVIDRNKWRVTAAEFGLRNAAAARKMVHGPGAIAVGNSPNGVYVLEEDSGEGLRHYVALYDRELQLQWRRSLPNPVMDWFVDDSGWIYVSMMSPKIRVLPGEHGSRTFEILAVTPEGETAWRWVHRPKPPARYWESLTVGTMVAAGDDLCFSMESKSRPPKSSPSVPELVCLSPRHGEAPE